MKGAQGTLGIFRACYFDQENGNAFDADGDNRLDHFVYTSISTADCPCILPVSPSAQYSSSLLNRRLSLAEVHTAVAYAGNSIPARSITSKPCPCHINSHDGLTSVISNLTLPILSPSAIAR